MKELTREDRGEINVTCKEIQMLVMFISTCCKLNQALDEIPGSIGGIQEGLDNIKARIAENTDGV